VRLIFAIELASAESDLDRHGVDGHRPDRLCDELFALES
jgi:hypothetical protein